MREMVPDTKEKEERWEEIEAPEEELVRVGYLVSAVPASEAKEEEYKAPGYLISAPTKEGEREEEDLRPLGYLISAIPQEEP